LLHVVEWPQGDAETLIEAAPGAYDFRRHLEDNAHRRLDALLPQTSAGCSLSRSIEYGRPYERILERAAADSTDLIVMGVHGRNALDLAVFGSTTNQIVRRATCPVLTLRH
jgi:nucleotide-binding universal stress UspA family protein